MGGPYFYFTVSCQYNGGTEQKHEIQLKINEIDGVTHSPPIITILDGNTNQIVEISEGVATPPNNIILTDEQLLIQSKDEIPEPNTHIAYSISTSPREFESFFEIEASNSYKQAFTYDPSEYKSETTAQLHIVKSIYYEDVIRLDQNSAGIIEICIRASSYISNEAARKSSTSNCFDLKIIE